MKKSNKILLIVIVFLAIVRFTGALRFFHVPTSACEPNLKLNAYFFGSSLVKPKAMDFGYFKFSDSVNGSIIVKRLIALPGDILECKKGEFIVNGINVDKDLNLRYSYLVSQQVYKNELMDEFKDDESFQAFVKNDSVVVFLDKSYVKNVSFSLNRNSSFYYESLSKDIFSTSTNWDLNNFGPIELPVGKYFFAGDNRDNTIDSRYRGFVDEKDIKGTLLIKF